MKRVLTYRMATFLALLFHLSGLLGILWTPYSDWFVQHTPLNLLLMAALLVLCQEEKKIFFFLFILLCFLVGIGVEMIGVNTGRLFGFYHYGKLLGPQWNGVPWLIGVNWFVIVYCSAAVMQALHDWFKEKMAGTNTTVSPRLLRWSLVIDGALLAVFFDWVMEPVAVKLGFWQWHTAEIPLFNYACWFVTSAFLLTLLRWFRFGKTNPFAIHLFIIQLLFFLALRIYL